MHGLTIRQKHNPQEAILHLRNPHPAPNATISLDSFPNWRPDGLPDPFLSDDSPIRATAVCLKVPCGFHVNNVADFRVAGLCCRITCEPTGARSTRTNIARCFARGRIGREIIQHLGSHIPSRRIDNTPSCVEPCSFDCGTAGLDGNHCAFAQEPPFCAPPPSTFKAVKALPAPIKKTDSASRCVHLRSLPDARPCGPGYSNAPGIGRRLRRWCLPALERESVRSDRAGSWSLQLGPGALRCPWRSESVSERDGRFAGKRELFFT